MCLIIDQFFFLLTKNLIAFTIKDEMGIPVETIEKYFGVELEKNKTDSSEEENKDANQN